MKKNWNLVLFLFVLLAFSLVAHFLVYYRFILTPEEHLLVGALTVAFAAIIGVVIGYNSCSNKGVWHLDDLIPGSFQIINVIETGKDKGVTQVKLSLRSKPAQVFLVDIDNYYFLGSGEPPCPNYVYHWDGKKLTFSQPTISREETSGV